MTFLGLEARTDLPKVPYPTALDFFVFLSFAFIFATIIQVGRNSKKSELLKRKFQGIWLKPLAVCSRSLLHKVWLGRMLFRNGNEFGVRLGRGRTTREKGKKGNWNDSNRFVIWLNKNRSSNGIRFLHSFRKMSLLEIWKVTEP